MTFATENWRIRAVAGLIGFTAFAAYANTLSAPFVFDDQRAIVENASIRHLVDLSAVLSPPPGTAGAVGRPVVNLSLALNYAFGGLQVRGYHLFNITIHALCGLVLFGLVRRTLLALTGPGEAARRRAVPLAAGVALLWVLHPLQTETVTCTIQRSESLASLLMLLTLYAAVRAMHANEGLAYPGFWYGVAIAANTLAMATKEIAVVTPVLVALYDWIFPGQVLAGRSAGNGLLMSSATRRAQLRWKFYAALAAGWILLGALVAGAHDRSGAAGFGLGVSSLDYALTQCWAIPHYLALVFWPQPLLVDYGQTIVADPLTVLPQIALLLSLLALTVWALVRRSAAGFAAAAFFLVLAPSSSVVPLVTQTIAEHRMYLPLAAVIALVVCGFDRWLRRWTISWVAIAAVALGAATVARNAVYRDELVLWRDTVAHRPGNARAHNNLGNALRPRDRAGLAAALPEYETAVRLQPDFTTARINLANTLLALDRVPEALAQYDLAVHAAPHDADAWHNRASALARAGRLDDAIASDTEALRLDPAQPGAHQGLANVCVQLGRFPEARQHYDAALRQEPDSASLHGNLANVLVTLGLSAAAIPHYEASLRLDPGNASVHNNFGLLLLSAGEAAKAEDQFLAALRLRPGFSAAQANLAKARALRR